MFSYEQNWEMRWPFQNTGNLLRSMYDDRWHRADPLDAESAWIPGKNPALRFNDPNHSNYNRSSDWWVINQKYLRMRTMELGYTVPAMLSQKLYQAPSFSCEFFRGRCIAVIRSLKHSVGDPLHVGGSAV